MFTSVISWVKGLSVLGKGALGVVSLGAIGVMSSPGVPPVLTAAESGIVKSQSVSAPMPVVTTEIITETQPIAYTKKTIETSNLNKGVNQVTATGVDGVQTLTFKITKTDGVETSRERVGDEITTEPIAEVTSVGTYVAPEPVQAPAPQIPNNCDPNYSPCVPNVNYDLDCSDIGFQVRVLGSDPHRFDREGDGYGCESY